MPTRQDLIPRDVLVTTIRKPGVKRVLTSACQQPMTTLTPIPHPQELPNNVTNNAQLCAHMMRCTATANIQMDATILTVCGLETTDQMEPMDMMDILDNGPTMETTEMIRAQSLVQLNAPSLTLFAQMGLMRMDALLVTIVCQQHTNWRMA